MQPRDVDAVVIGGGLAGLVAAWQLTQRGLRPVLIEARGYVGGLVAGTELGQLTFDIGAESFAVRGGAVQALCDELGVATEPPNEGGSWVYFDDATFRLPTHAILGLPEDVTAAEIVAAIGLDAVARAAALDAAPVTDVPRDLAGLVRTRLGEDVLTRLVTPIAGGIHSADPSLLAADVVIPGITDAVRREGSLQAAVKSLRRPGSPIATCTGGQFRLAEALRDAILAADGEVWTRTGTESIVRDGDRWLVPAAETVRGENPSEAPRPAGEPRPLRAPRVVIACSSTPARALLADHVELGDHQLDIGSPIAHLTLVLDAPELDARPRGTGMLVAPGTTGVAAKALTHLTSKWNWLGQSAPAGRHVLRISYGRVREPYPQPTLAGGLADASRMLGVELSADQVVDHRLIRWDGTLAPLTPATRDWTAGIVRQLGSRPGLALTGAWVAGTGLAALVPHARRVAKELA